jgi:hypothetical protein
MENRSARFRLLQEPSDLARENRRIQLMCIETLRLDFSGVLRLESAFAVEPYSRTPATADRNHGIRRRRVRRRVPRSLDRHNADARVSF